MIQIDQHLATITSLDLRGHAEAKRRRARLEWAEKLHAIADTREAEKAAKAIRHHIKRTLAPHRVEFAAGPSFATNHTNMTARFHCAFEVWPDTEPRPDGCKSHVRAPIKVNTCGARDAAELAHILTGLREAADRLALMMFTDSGERAKGNHPDAE